MRRFLVLALITCLAASAFVAPASAGKKKKKKKPAPIEFSAEGAFQVGNPGDFLAGAGLVRNELALTCAIPLSQGTDGFVVELPAEFQQINSEASLEGTDLMGGPDLDMYFYDETCTYLGEVATAELNEYGIVPAGTRFVAVSAFIGAGVSFTLDLVELI